jgi:hypothetical protein
MALGPFVQSSTTHQFAHLWFPSAGHLFLPQGLSRWWLVQTAQQDKGGCDRARRVGLHVERLGLAYHPLYYTDFVSSFGAQRQH